MTTNQLNDQETDPITGVRSYGIKVLLVDDQRIIAEAVRRDLAEADDIEFHYCSDPTKAIKQAAELKPTLILQDLVMPEIDGLMMLRFYRVAPETAKIPIIVLSTKEEPETKSEAFALGANDYLVKLPDKIELIARIRYHSQSYINQLQRDEAFRALQESQKQLAEANQALQKLSSLDGLTGIANRRRFDEFLEAEWRRGLRQAQPLSVIILDIDFFKLYNDHYGHQQGDDCLKQVAATLAGTATREGDLVARYGGEEFTVVLPETEAEGAWAVAEELRTGVQEQKIPHAQSKVSEYVSISVGTATLVPTQDSKPAEIVALADKALYLAKQEGRNRVMGHG
ncbi:diguanylate cyclase domain-containing protein [Desulfurivibrio sp. D14AmB]|uniref:diguanylate cyclase domain-containing protein n=1 Tax=Desulfurivibrio sp. D14AmB TaxID=3374370 RepID=UPI00376F2744